MTANSTNSKFCGQDFVSNPEGICARVILGHQQPSGHASLEQMEMCADRRLGKLAHVDVQVAINLASQGLAS